jgi:hypothetical protein
MRSRARVVFRNNCNNVRCSHLMVKCFTVPPCKRASHCDERILILSWNTICIRVYGVILLTWTNHVRLCLGKHASDERSILVGRFFFFIIFSHCYTGPNNCFGTPLLRQTLLALFLSTVPISQDRPVQP